MTVIELAGARHTSVSQTSPADDPRWEMLVGGAVAALFFFGLMGWGAVAPMDEAADVAGAVVVSGHRQAIQAAEGGVVSAIEVHEGDRVVAGQVLVQFAPAEAIADERGLASRAIQLEAQLARLDAEQLGQASITPPKDFDQLAPDDRPLAAQALAIEQRALIADYGADHARRGAMVERMAQAGQQILGYQRELEANQRQQSLNQQELAGVRDLAAQGYAPLNRVRALEHSAAGLEGEAGAQQAAIAQLKANSAESRMQIAQGDNERTAQLADERRHTEDELEQIQPSLRSAEERLARTAARAPVSGSVIGLAVNTVGAVVGPGERLMEVLPDHGQLVVSAQVPANQAGALRPGQPATLRVASVSGPASTLHGVVSRVAPDVVVNQQTGHAFYEIEVSVSPAELAATARNDAAQLEFRPGAPVDIVIPLRKRTALQYWMEPLTQSLSHAFREP